MYISSTGTLHRTLCKQGCCRSCVNCWACSVPVAGSAGCKVLRSCFMIPQAVGGAILQGRWRRSSGRPGRSWQGCAPSAGGCSASGPPAKPRWPPCRCNVMHFGKGTSAWALMPGVLRTQHRAPEMAAWLEVSCLLCWPGCLCTPRHECSVLQLAGGECSAGGGGSPEAAPHHGADRETRPPGPRVRFKPSSSTPETLYLHFCSASRGDVPSGADACACNIDTTCALQNPAEARPGW